jgi:hypothetical protein
VCRRAHPFCQAEVACATRACGSGARACTPRGVLLSVVRARRASPRASVKRGAPQGVPVACRSGTIASTRRSHPAARRDRLQSGALASRGARWPRRTHATRAQRSFTESGAAPACGCWLFPTGQRRPEGVAPVTRNAAWCTNDRLSSHSTRRVLRLCGRSLLVAPPIIPEGLSAAARFGPRARAPVGSGQRI